jgi:hypothetical protein
MTEICASAIKGTVMRLVAVDTCGIPVTGSSSAVVVTDGFISIAPSPQYEEGEVYQQRNAGGRFCINEKGEPELSRVSLAIQMCVLDPDAFVLITGERLLRTSGVTGTGVAGGTGLVTARFSLETWQKVTGAGRCNAAGQQQYVYWAWPNVGHAMVQDYSIENGPLTMAFNAETEDASLQWGNGPGSAGPWIDENVASGDHWLFNITSTAPPTSSCGAVLLS